jgi:putative membrane-bound dehydrogenase-like protein
MTRITLCLALAAIQPLPAADPPETGPSTEKRFPPLKVPAGFKATLFACDPLIEYPSVIAIGPKQGTLFVAHDYMTGLGTDGVVKSEVRLIEDTDGDGYADKSTIYAKGFNSIEGMAYHNGTVYVMHAPFLTALRDTKGTGVADERKDLLEGLGLTPEKNPVRLHCANGVVVGHDGWLYLAMGDNGTNVKRPEGDRLILNGGGILRCRKDGSDLHIFATGTRNIYDISLDEDLNVFFRDNENDGGTYMIRVCHSFFGADHGYPYKYYERPDEALRPLGDFGLGSSAGGVCYLETQFPKEYRGNLFNCEWGKSVVRCVPKREGEGSGFAQLKEIEFAAGADNDPYGFKPTDIVVDHDGSMLVSDWADGQRPKRGRGRIYRISYVGAKNEPPMPFKKGGLASDSYQARVKTQLRIEQNGRDGAKAYLDAMKRGAISPRERMHLVWALTNTFGPDCIDDLFQLAQSASIRVQMQAVRALADLADPVLAKHRLDAGAGDARIAARLSELNAKAFNRDDPGLLLEIVIALGRLRWTDSPVWLQKTLKSPDATLSHAAMMTLRKCDNWPAVLKLLDLPDSEPIRAIALRALAEQAIPEVVDGVLKRLDAEKDSKRRQEYADLLSRVYKKPGEWVYWGYRPPPRPANTEKWEKTESIEKALNGLLGDGDGNSRLFVLKRMQREKIAVRHEPLVKWLKAETKTEPLLTIIDALREHPADLIREPLEKAVEDKKKPTIARIAALNLLATEKKSAELLVNMKQLFGLAQSLEDGPVLAETIKLLAKKSKIDQWLLVLKKHESKDATVRAAAIDALVDGSNREAAAAVSKRLADADANARRAAASACGRLNVVSASPDLLKLTADSDPRVRNACFDSLRMLKEAKAVPLAVAALDHPDTREAALRCIAELGGPDQTKAIVDVARQNPSAQILSPVLRALTTWSKQSESKRAELDAAVADLQGVSGILGRWRTTGPVRGDALIQRFAVKDPEKRGPDDPDWDIALGTGLESRLHLPLMKGEWLAYADLGVAEPSAVQILAGCNSGIRIWINGKQAFKRDEVQPFLADSIRFDATFEKGKNRVLIHFPTPKADIDFHLRFRRKSSTALHEKLTQAALTRAGNIEKGSKLFLNIERTQCLKCHRVGEQGEKIGPDLTGIGNRFSRIHLIESILEPSRTIASSFQTLAITTSDGKTITGVKFAESDKTIEVGDKDGKKHVIMKADIEAQRVEKLSVMPDGLEKPLSNDEFVDLIAYLASLKETHPK